MCDPVSLSVASTVIGAAGTAAGAMTQRSAQRKQEREVNTWQEQQRKNRFAEGARQEGLRQEATRAQQAGLQQVSAADQQKRQADEEARLAAYLKGDSAASQATPEAGVPTAVADTEMFSGQEAGGEEFKTELAKKISEVTSAAKQRIGALARVSSYGESFGGLGTMNPILQQQSGAAIDAQNEFRRGSLGAYGTEQNVDPVQVSYTPSPLADVFSTMLSAGTQGMGNAFGNPLIGGGAGSSMASRMKYIPPVPGLPQTTTTIPTAAIRF